ncbi:MAG TPA: response regulator [Methylomirabilota bacterium]|nr:response regulator [Methylomirabilota bacterium]
MNNTDYNILLVDDEENDATLVKMAFKQNNIISPIQWVKDGVEAVAYLNAEGIYADRIKYPFPQVLLLDLKMPRMTGLELLQWLRVNSHFKIIPTIIMTSSRQETDIEKAYDLGVNTYMIKPSSFDELKNMVKAIHEYWAISVKPKPRWSRKF